MKKVLKVLGGIIAFCFCIVILIVQLGTHVLFFTNQIVSEKTLNKIVDKTSISLLLENEDGNLNSFSEDIYKSMNKMGFDKEAVNKIADSQGLKNIIKGILKNGREAVIDGKKDEIITSDEIKELVNNNIDNIIAESGVKLDSNKRTKLLDEATSLLTDVTKELPKVSTLSEKAPDLKDMKLVFNKNTKIEMIITIVVLTLIIAFFEWSFIKCLRDSGIITIIAGTIISLIGVIIAFVLSYVLSGVPSLINYISFIKPILNIIGMIFIINGGIALAAGIIQLIIASAIRKTKDKTIEKGTILAE